MEVKTKLYLVNSDGDKFMGIGVLWLLKKIGSFGSLRAAAASLGISYSKAYAMVKNLEQQLGLAVVDRKRGGAEHEGSSLTEFGERFLLLYDTFQTKAKERLEEPFTEFSQDFERLRKEFEEPKERS